MFILSFCFVGCNDESNNNEAIELEIPSKHNPIDSASRTSPVNSHNLDEYMFRDDVQYVDLRNPEMILQDGYVAGFSFIPYYSVIASFNAKECLYQMKTVIDEEGNRYPAGQVGGFVAQYEESEILMKSLFAKDKYIFIISQGGSEASYLIKLLLQLGYDGNLLYNVGGVSNGEGIASYKSIETNKYFVSGSGNLDVTTQYAFTDDLTPLE